MKKIIKSILVLSIFTFIATSCSDENEVVVFKAPVISNLEVGAGEHEEGDKGKHDHEEGVGHIGEDLHIEADIVAEGKIASITVEIHNEKTGKDVVEKTFTGEFVGLKNTKFHKHVDIPATTVEGDYHFHLKVVDQQGQSTEKEMDIKLEKEDE